MSTMKLVAVSGGLGHPSRAAALAKAITEAIAARMPIDAHAISVADLVQDLAGVISAKSAPASVSEAVTRIETADALVVTTPVYRGSYTGLFKHLFDLVHHEALIGKPVLLAATGGSDRHSLMIDHQLRPLFAFFQSLTLPLGVYANDSDFSNYEVSSDALKERIQLAVESGIGYLELRG
ncbi:FMN reductase [Methylosinus sp. LW4]|uniref:FMN reductase n=1 Tax=Methylosinus sp. LW4 TaxID=136993 RepID=UPI00039E7F1A|nr:FMN reductase [Methylosinus sp. LW4]